MTRGFYIFFIVLFASLFACEKINSFKTSEDHLNSIESLTSFYENELKSAFAGKELIAQDVKEMKQLIVSSQKDIESIKEQYSNFKKISSVVKIESSTSVKDTKIPIIRNEIVFVDSMVSKEIVNQFYIPKNSKSSYSDDWIDLSFTIGDSLEIDSIVTRNKYDAVLGWKKPDKPFKFLRKSEPVLEVISYSPYSEIGHVNNIIVREEESKFKKAIMSPPFLVGIGLIGGYFIFKN